MSFTFHIKCNSSSFHFDIKPFYSSMSWIFHWSFAQSPIIITVKFQDLMRLIDVLIRIRCSSFETGFAAQSWCPAIARQLSPIIYPIDYCAEFIRCHNNSFHSGLLCIPTCTTSIATSSFFPIKTIVRKYKCICWAAYYAWNIIFDAHQFLPVIYHNLRFVLLVQS